MAGTKRTKYDMSIRCHFGKNNYTQHHQWLALEDVKKWVEAYRFTHPNVESFSIKIWVRERPTKGTGDE